MVMMVVMMMVVPPRIVILPGELNAARAAASVQASSAFNAANAATAFGIGAGRSACEEAACSGLARGDSFCRINNLRIDKSGSSGWATGACLSGDETPATLRRRRITGAQRCPSTLFTS